MAILKIKDKGVWKEIQAIKGDTGNGIQNIEKVSTVENVDTYAINYTDGTQTTFDVTNGEVTKEQLDEVDNRAKKTRNELERVKNDVLETGTATDTFVHLEDSAMAEYQELSADGVREQETTTGKNLFNVSKLDVDMRYQCTTNISDGKITITSNASTGVSFCRLKPDLKLKPNTTYSISFDFEGSINQMRLYDVTANEYINISQSGTSRRIGKFTTNDNTDYRLVIYVVSNQSMTVSKIQVEEGTVATTYEPYTGNQPSPNPYYPQEIEVGRGKNLWNTVPYEKNKFINAEGTIVSSVDDISIWKTEDVKENTDYTISYTGLGAIFRIHAYDSKGNWIQQIKGITSANGKKYKETFTTPSGTTALMYSYYTAVTNNEHQLEKGSVATSYLPYNTIEVKSTGKNMLNPVGTSKELSDLTFTNNGDGSFTVKGTATSNRSFGLTNLSKYPINLKKGEYYTQSLIVLSGTMAGSIVPAVKNVNGDITYNYLSSNATQLISKQKAEEDYSIYSYDWYCASGTTVDVTFKVQLEEGSNDTDYEPYKESSITANLPEGEFIGKISDTYKDTLKVEYNEDDGQHHLKLYKNVGKVVLDGSENWSYASKLGAMYLPNYMKAIGNNEIGTYSNKYKATTRNDYNVSNYTIYGNNTGVLSIRDTDYTDKTSFKAYLSSSKPIVYYALAEPYAVDLGVVDMPITYNEITNLFTDSNLSLTINAKYYRNFISTVRNLQVNEKALKQELVDINTRLSALETAQTSTTSESEVIK